MITKISSVKTAVIYSGSQNVLSTTFKPASTVSGNVSAGNVLKSTK